jgi:hypothetical protein
MVASTAYDNADNRSNYTVTGAANTTNVIGVNVVALGVFVFIPVVSQSP